MKVSILTIHLNDPGGLRRTLESLRPILDNPDFEWVVVDGGTSAQTGSDQDLLNSISKLAKYISESDNGIYDAMNKGTSMASGDYILYLNAGDELHADFSIHGLEMELGECLPEMIWGTCHERFPDGRLVKMKNRSPKLAWYGVPVNHQNVFFRRDILGVKPYRERYQYLADYDLISRLLTGGAQVHRSDIPFAIFQRGGISALNFAQTIREEEELRSLHFGVNRHASRAISLFKQLTGKIGSVPAFRLLLRKWV